jgi:hypothetical protein
MTNSELFQNPVRQLSLLVTLLVAILFLLSSCGGGGGNTDPLFKSDRTISGSAHFEDRIFNGTGFTGSQKKPVRHARVQAVSSMDGAVLGESYTDPEGSFDITITVSPEDVFYLRCLTADEQGAIKVTDMSANVYAYRGADSTIGSLSADIYAQGENAEPFNIFDAVTDGFLYVQALTGAPVESPLTVLWEAGNTDGTYFNVVTNSIYLYGIKSGNAADDDGWDDCVILHEFGHFVAFRYSEDDSPGGPHSLDESYDKRLAWSEGWATFFALKVRAWRGDVEPRHYLDTTGEYILGPDTVRISYEIETPSVPYSPTPVSFLGDANEVSVSAALWDIADNPSQDDDPFSDGMPMLWDVFTTYIPSNSNTCNDVPAASTCVSFEDFFEGWINKGYADLTPVLAQRSVEYRPDGFEPNETSSAPTAYAEGGLHFTYFPIGDFDWISFNAEAGKGYEITTENILGADTELRLYSPSVAFINTNDDIGACPEQSCRASKITFTAETTGTYYIESYTSPLNYFSYGSYDLLISPILQ